MLTAGQILGPFVDLGWTYNGGPGETCTGEQAASWQDGNHVAGAPSESVVADVVSAMSALLVFRYCLYCPDSRRRRRHLEFCRRFTA
ncbi:hypothetical protein BD311DRAFT_413351 [Dichomitus squalens]|uniref:Uncharacterized protein n=1 Tax=Dichomitus squalens TaxID=114155 RepID=A0A4Q9MLF9_9APHY|nr:hypothetical protein BD311DRAFT_413351 [Dichomitus squalens]TBU56096.1 hypothetical protein BD310DRAFT_640019 [Dichomitus squalens]